MSREPCDVFRRVFRCNDKHLALLDIPAKKRCVVRNGGPERMRESCLPDLRGGDQKAQDAVVRQ